MSNRRRLFRPGRLLPAVVLCGLLAAASAAAAPDFARTSIEPSTESPREGELLEFTVRLRNTGDQPAEHAQLSIEGPRMGYLVEVTGLPGAAVDYDLRRATASVSLPVNGEVPVRLQVLAPRNSANNILSVTVHLAHYPTRAELWQHESVVIEPRPARGGLVVGPVRFNPAGLALIAWLAATLLLWAVLHRASPPATAGRRGSARRVRAGRPLATALAVMIPVGFWMIFAAMAWRDLQTLTTWREATATILGRRAIVTSDLDGPAANRPRPAATSGSVTPEFALRYLVEDVEVVSTGYDSGSSLRIGGRVTREEELRDWTAGKTISCWYDPADPTDVIVRRGFGGAYFFALIPVPIFWLGAVQLRRAWRARAATARRP